MAKSLKISYGRRISFGKSPRFGIGSVVRWSGKLLLLLIGVGIGYQWALYDIDSQDVAPSLDDECRVVAVIDGDTVDVVPLSETDTPQTTAKGSVKERVRLWGIDAPETSQDFGKESRAWLSSLILNKPVILEKVEKDRYGRTVARIRLDGQDVNEDSLRQGMSWYYERYAPKAGNYRDAEQEARSSGVGLWKNPEAQAPWEFRSGPRPQTSTGNL